MKCDATSGDGLYIGYLKADGSIEKIENSRYENGYMVFTVDHLSEYAILKESGSGSGVLPELSSTMVLAVILAVLIIGALGTVVTVRKR